MNLITKSIIEINTIIANKRPFGYKPSPHTGENTCVSSIPKNINTNAFSVKAIVDSIVDELANDGRIKKLYDLWYEQKENIIRTYTDEMPDRIPLAQNKEFKSIKNAIIKEALKLKLAEDEVEEIENADEEPVTSPFKYEENTSVESVFDSGRGVLYPHYSIKTNRNSVAVSSLNLLRYLCNMIQNQLRFEEKQKAQRTDKKLQQKINDKKQAQGLKM